jgi:hypothetical protein
MLNGLALRNGFEAAPKVRKNLFECSVTGAWWMNHGIEVPYAATSRARPSGWIANNVKQKRGCFLHSEAARARMKYGWIFISEFEQDPIW